MADLSSQNRKLFIMKYEHQQLVCKAQIQAKEIKMIELQEEIERCKGDIDAQNKTIADMDENIAQQKELMVEEKANTE
ncbi:MAG: hypothetical protein ACW99G_06890 [Candidatus Thorarchaeota archaeon]|jgi:hypothetical protein